MRSDEYAFTKRRGVSSRRAEILELSGRALIVFGAAFATTQVASGSRVVWSLLFAAIWLVSIQAGFAANATELLALGDQVAVTRGVILGLVSVSAVSAWRRAPQSTRGGCSSVRLSCWFSFWPGSRSSAG